MREYRVWRPEEENALRAGVLKHGTGAWEVIRTDPEYHQLLKGRTGVQLKDKWRNLVKFRHLTASELGCLSQNSAQKNSRKAASTAERAEPPARRVSAAPPAKVAPPLPLEGPSPSVGASEYEHSDAADAGPSTSSQRTQRVMSVSELLNHIRDYHGRKKALAQSTFNILTVATDELTDALRGLSDSKAAQKRLQVAEAEQKSIKDKWMALTTEVQNAGIILDTVQEMYQNNEPIQLNLKEEEICPPKILELVRAATEAPQSMQMLHTDVDTPPTDGRPTRSASAMVKRQWAALEDRRFGIYDERRYQSPRRDSHQGSAGTSPEVGPALDGVSVPKRGRSKRPRVERPQTKWTGALAQNGFAEAHYSHAGGDALGAGSVAAAAAAAAARPHAVPSSHYAERRDDSGKPPAAAAADYLDEGEAMNVATDFVDDLHRQFSMEDWEMAELAVRALDGLSKGDGPGLSGMESQHPRSLSPLMPRSPEHDCGVTSSSRGGDAGGGGGGGGIAMGYATGVPMMGDGAMTHMLDGEGGDARGGGSQRPQSLPLAYLQPAALQQHGQSQAAAQQQQQQQQHMQHPQQHVIMGSPAPSGPILVYPQLVYPALTTGLEDTPAGSRPQPPMQQHRYVMAFPASSMQGVSYHMAQSAMPQQQHLPQPPRLTLSRPQPLESRAVHQHHNNTHQPLQPIFQPPSQQLQQQAAQQQQQQQQHTLHQHSGGYGGINLWDAPRPDVKRASDMSVPGLYNLGNPNGCLESDTALGTSAADYSSSMTPALFHDSLDPFITS